LVEKRRYLQGTLDAPKPARLPRQKLSPLLKQRWRYTTSVAGPKCAVGEKRSPKHGGAAIIKKSRELAITVQKGAKNQGRGPRNFVGLWGQNL